MLAPACAACYSADMTSLIRTLVDALYARPYHLLTLAAIFWACNAIAGQMARGEITARQHVLIRWIFGAGFMWAIYGREVIAYWHAARSAIWRIIVMSIAGFTAFNLLFYLASFNTSGVNVGILQGSVPVFVILFGLILHRTLITPLQTLGVLGTMLGVAVVATQGTPWLALEIDFNDGDLIMLAACASYAFYAILLKHRPDMPGAVLFTLMSGIALVTSVPPVLIEMALADETYAAPTLFGVLLTLFVAVFPGILAQQFFLRGVDLIGPQRAGIFTNLVPVFASALAVMILGQVFALYHALALVLVLGGIWLAQRSI
ncbi:MAG: DMT family transporter [Pseudomonadota bacterium]